MAHQTKQYSRKVDLFCFFPLKVYGLNSLKPCEANIITICLDDSCMIYSLYLPLQEIHPNGLFIVSGEDSLAVSLDHGRLAYSAIAYHHYLV